MFIDQAVKRHLELMELIENGAPLWLPDPDNAPQMAAYLSPAKVIGYGGCVSGDTEYLTPQGWKRIDEYDGGQVAVWNEKRRTFRFEQPSGFVDAPTADGKLIEFRSCRVSMALSPEHRMPLYKWDKQFCVKTAAQVRTRTSRHWVPVVTTPAGAQGLQYTDDEVRLMVAVHADGNFERTVKTARCRVSLRKTRKRERLEKLLTNLGIPWREYHNPLRPTEVRYSFDAPARTKTYADWWCASAHQLEVVLDELSHWDGVISGARGGDITFSTTQKADADFVQYAAHACGRVATIGVTAARGAASELFRVHITREKVLGVALRQVEKTSKGEKGTRIRDVPAARQYCFKTSTGFWVMRRGGLIACTGNSAGGGKSDLGIGKALNQHADSMILRRVGTELTPIVERILALRGTRDGYTASPEKILRMPERGPHGQTITFGAVPNLGDETKYQGHPDDLKVFDEATNFVEWQVRFLSTWLRNTRVPGMFAQMLLTFNPPQTSEGRWVIPYFGPWLDRTNNNPAAHGELRYFITLGVGQQQVDREVQNMPCVIIDNEPVYDFDAAKFKQTEIITPQSRTFIGSKVTDNKYQDAAYMAQLQSLPEPLRSQMLNGDFFAGMNDSEWQVIPTAWVQRAMDRWQPRDRKGPMDAMGIDVARGGSDNTIFARRHDNWYDEPLAYPGTQTPNGRVVMGLAAAALRDDATIYIDVVGVGGSPYDYLAEQKYHVIGVNGGEAKGIDAYRSQGNMGYANWKSYCWWSMREDLDPANERGVALPPDKQLLRDLTAPMWKPRGGKILVESREEIIKRIGRSPDWGNAYILARLSMPRLERLRNAPPAMGHDPMAIVNSYGSTGHDPMNYGGHTPF